ncbi:hypothetical protein ABZX62_26870 [Streptomyces flavidovirens]|uniref:Uncharacterized protein n=1 Tax=Streptomyces flavidovirens TaxID=67298 RepID=A0ABW6RPT2_9ACTN
MLLFLAKNDNGPPKIPGTDLSTWIMVRLDVSETGENALEEQERRRHS